MKKMRLLLLACLALAGLNAVYAVERPAVTVTIPDNKTEIEANMRQARHYMEKGDYAKAIEKLNRVLELDSDHAEAKTLLVECRQKVQKQKEAEYAELQKAINKESVQALRDFCERYPRSEYVAQAEKCIQDFELWDEARRLNTKAAYQQYLSASTLQGYKSNAEQAIKAIEADEAWASCRNSKSQTQLENYLNKYPGSKNENEARYELNLVKAEKCYSSGSYNTALGYYNDAANIHSLSGTYLSHYRDAELEVQFEAMKYSNSVSEMRSFLSRVTSSSKYYDPISNRLALTLGSQLSTRSTESDFNTALSYARDKNTRTRVEQYISNVKQRQKEQRRVARRNARRENWKDRFSVGWNIFDCFIGDDVLEMESGLRMRVGKTGDLINFVTGMDLQYFMTSTESYDYYGYSISEYNNFMKLGIPATLRVNLGGENSAFYLGLGAYIWPNWGSSHNAAFAIEPQLGLIGKHFDIGLNLRCPLDRYGVNSMAPVGTMVGYNMVLYF